MGIKPEPKSITSSRLGSDKNTDKFTVNSTTKSDDWGLNSASSGWDDFVTDPGLMLEFIQSILCPKNPSWISYLAVGVVTSTEYRRPVFILASSAD